MKSLCEIKNSGGINNFFECPYDMQEVMFNLITENKQFISQNQLYKQNKVLFDNHIL